MTWRKKNQRLDKIADATAPTAAHDAADTLDVTKKKIERKLAAIAFADIRDFYNADGTLKPVREWTKEMSDAVAEIEILEEYQGEGANPRFIGRVRKVQLWPRQKALAILGAAYGIVLETVSEEGTVIQHGSRDCDGEEL